MRTIKKVLTHEQVKNYGIVPIKGKKYVKTFGDQVSINSLMRYDYECVYEELKVSSAIWVK